MARKTDTNPIFYIAALVAIGPLATDMYLPALPTLTEAFDTTASRVQLTLSVYFVGFAVGQLVYGPVSDRFGRKSTLQVGLTLFAVSSALIPFVTTIEELIAARFLQALGGCAGPVLGRAMVRDLYDPQQSARALSHIASSMALAPAVAPVIGGYLTVLYGWQSSFWFLLAYGLVALSLLSFALPETLSRRDLHAMRIRQLLTNYRTLIAHREWRLHTLICSFSFAGLFAFLSGSAFVLIEYLQVAEQHFGFLFASVVAGYILGSQIAARLTLRYTAMTLIRVGCWLGLAAATVMLVLSLAGAHSVAAVIVPQFFYMLAVGMIMPLTMAGALAPFPHMAGAASALLGTTQMLIAAAHGGLVAHLYSGTPTVMAAGIAVAGSVAFVGMQRLRSVSHPA